MAPIKRKAAPPDSSYASRKRVKSADLSLPVRSINAPTEEDSDPITESDTNSESGDDDGASWPSQGHSDHGDQWDGIEKEEMSDDNGSKAGGVAISRPESNPRLDGKTDYLAKSGKY